MDANKKFVDFEYRDETIKILSPSLKLSLTKITIWMLEQERDNFSENDLQKVLDKNLKEYESLSEPILIAKRVIDKFVLLYIIEQDRSNDEPKATYDESLSPDFKWRLSKLGKIISMKLYDEMSENIKKKILKL